ncbi:tetratricopeptide repeat protein [Arsenicibacter rosenii]|uniref:histidine kinase n=1 Tax=Arsenicibacter rosenii TaxID=1750698 RepID=A0A1S2VHP2_9BACT|nr:tetratricopeptide repeat protein [Arsenicibacter rosenii]OIN57930.1 hypothetical protein BLX24_17720 [Arsenicibacter rosenii]
MWKVYGLISFVFLLSHTSVGQAFNPAIQSNEQSGLSAAQCDQFITRALQKADLLYQRQQYQSTYQTYVQALETARSCPAPRHQLPVLISFAKFLKSRGNKTAALAYLKQHLQITTALKSHSDSIVNYYRQADIYTAFGDFPRSLELLLKAQALAEKPPVSSLLVEIMSDLGLLYSLVGDYEEAFNYQKRALKILKPGEISKGSALILARIGENYLVNNRFREAIPYFKQALHQTQRLKLDTFAATVMGNLARAYVNLGDYKQTFYYGIPIVKKFKQVNNQGFLTWTYVTLARAYLNTQRPDSALVLALPAYRSGVLLGSKENARDAAGVLADIYAHQKDYLRAFQFQKAYTSYKDSLNNELTSRRVAYLEYNQKLLQKQSQIAQLEEEKVLNNRVVSQQRLVVLMLLIGLGAGAFLVRSLTQANHKLKYSNQLLAIQKAEIDEQAGQLKARNGEIDAQRKQLQNTVTELQKTQNQLVLKEKMASLGELATGIAHEIQNPLNFVNNFAIVSTTLVSEIKNHLNETTDSKPRQAADSLTVNLDRIIHHGQRAESIIKGMLQHSHLGTGDRQPVDINALASDYLQQSYKSVCQKNKQLNNVRLHLDLQPVPEKVVAVPQDLSRVFVNLYNNAFYTLGEKLLQAADDYQPGIWVSSTYVNNRVIIRVKDNGMGIPANIVHKIFQPFFTTKPTGHGAGLGLSLSYDIITKGYGGQLIVDTQWGKFTEFSISIPV